jgi:dolichyl-phosphate beta-glucosyltransferase
MAYLRRFNFYKFNHSGGSGNNRFILCGIIFPPGRIVEEHVTKPYLSIIIPAHNEEKRLPHTLEQAFDFVNVQPYPAEILVVENGSQDKTLQISQDFATAHPQVRVFQEAKSGKGLAVQRGMLEACGEYRFMCDADLSMPIQQVNRFLPPVLTDFDIAIASREAPGAIRYHEPLYRHWGGRAINLIIRILALPGLRDTQCGFKCFRASIAEDLFRVQTLARWAFDIELLYVASQRSYRIIEVPIPWYYRPESKVNVVRDAVQMIADILAIRRKAKHGVYDQVRS